MKWKTFLFNSKYYYLINFILYEPTGKRGKKRKRERIIFNYLTK